MAYLDWKEGKVTVETSPHSRFNSHLKLGTNSEAIETLVLKLEEVYLGQAGELRLELPGQWTLFWKLRDETSRTLLARPQPGFWVATLALELELAKKLIFALKNLQKGESLEVSSLGSLDYMSNLELSVSRTD